MYGKYTYSDKPERTGMKHEDTLTFKGHLLYPIFDPHGRQIALAHSVLDAKQITQGLNLRKDILTFLSD